MSEKVREKVKSELRFLFILQGVQVQLNSNEVLWDGI